MQKVETIILRLSLECLDWLMHIIVDFQIMKEVGIIFVSYNMALLMSRLIVSIQTNQCNKTQIHILFLCYAQNASFK